MASKMMPMSPPGSPAVVAMMGKMTASPRERDLKGGGGDGDTLMDITSQQKHNLQDVDRFAPGQPSLKELFEKMLSQKKNIYSTDPIPLNNPWTFWVDKTERGVNLEQYNSNLRCIYTFYTVQRFWAVYYNIPKPSDLQPRSSLHMMRDDRKPVWEEEYNCKGGTFRLRVQKKDSNKVWIELLLAAIGEQFNEFIHEKDEICGISISTREKEDCILIWNTNAELAKDSKILQYLSLILPDTVFIATFYKPHFTHHAFEKGNGPKQQQGSQGGPPPRSFKLQGPQHPRSSNPSGGDH
ncbi:eukaryotic translation initiation factor 4E type 3-B isoform X2 [Folsomia candida]|uniref:Eukaryotic translation initiation factor 4E type 3-B n=1 Tax=Folsomia candida TaxID=158441 RepID=A0A226DZ31_FOLCA|nr:eukaryotic translation initiation factor 4E type 3-B isoform X2 [Folsomia candida]OXA49987.1 Eukaryotic translation initiation factor 4E type 3-B [Folsomia candida]